MRRRRRDPAQAAAVNRLALTELERSSPVLFLGVTIVVVVVQAVNWLLGLFNTLDVLTLAAVGVPALLTWRFTLPKRVLPWLWVGAAAVLIASTSLQMVQTESMMQLGYVLVACAIFPPFTLMWRPTLVAGAWALACMIAVGFYTYPQFGHAMWGKVEPSDAVVQTAAALGAGLVALYFRRASLAGTVDTTSELEEQALTDELTGVLNRRGIETRGRSLIDRTRGERFALFVDVNGLKEVNDSKGHDDGDALLRGVASALRHVMRTTDLIGRWGGDEFVVIGAGREPDPSLIERRTLEVLSTLGVTRISTRGVSVGGASGVLDYDRLIEAADADMYERRAAKGRSRPTS